MLKIPFAIFFYNKNIGISLVKEVLKKKNPSVNISKHRWKKSKKTAEDWQVQTRQNQYCETGCLTKHSLQIQWGPHQNPNDILHRNINTNPKIRIKAQTTPNGQSNSE